MEYRLPVKNQWEGCGRLTHDPTIKEAKNGTKYIRFGIACNRRYQVGGEWKDDTLFITCCAWGNWAEIIGENCHKGTPVLIEGRLENKDWEMKDGEKRRTIEVRVYHCQILSKREEKEQDDIPF